MALEASDLSGVNPEDTHYGNPPPRSSEIKEGPCGCGRENARQVKHRESCTVNFSQKATASPAGDSIAPADNLRGSLLFLHPTGRNRTWNGYPDKSTLGQGLPGYPQPQRNRR